MVLTRAGHRLYDLATEILSKMEEAKLEINQMVFGQAGEIRLSAECFSTYNWLPSVMKGFHQLYPNVDFYSGIVQRALGIPTSMFTAIFAMARTVGWVAQWNEMVSDPTYKIGRPRQLYTGTGMRDIPSSYLRK